MKVAVVSKDKRACSLLKRLVAQYGFSYDEKKPDVVVTYGGDGTLLHAERVYPGVPKLPIRGGVSVCHHCHDHPLRHALDSLKRRLFKKIGADKLEIRATSGKKKVASISLNDCIVRNAHLGSAIRYDVLVDGTVVAANVIGDGVVVSTAYGSTAYFQSITKRSFSKGVGVAFNNTTRLCKHLVLPASSVVTVRLTRGPAEVAADNLQLPVVLNAGDTVTARLSSRKSAILRPQ